MTIVRRTVRDVTHVVSNPLVVAHRGSSFAQAEHTLDAYIRAIDEGADALECDVRLTRDGHLVCVHDRLVDRTSNGRGPVSEFDLADLHALDFSSWHRSKATGGYTPMQDARPGRSSSILTLESLLELVVDSPRPTHLYIETKHPNRYAGLVEQRVVRLLRRFNLAQPREPGDSLITVMSFASVGVRRFRLLAPKLPSVLLQERMSPFRKNGSLPRYVRMAGININYLRLDPDYVGRVHAQGNRLYVWTVNESDEIALAASLGVDVMATDRPVDVLRHLGRIVPSSWPTLSLSG